MTTGQPDRPAPAASLPGEAAVASEDLTARARIREAALSHFAEEGYERATVRGIARTAGVSPGLLRHHFGSKQELRQACDEYVAGVLRRINAISSMIRPTRSAPTARPGASSGTSRGPWSTGPSRPGRSSRRW